MILANQSVLQTLEALYLAAFVVEAPARFAQQ